MAKTLLKGNYQDFIDGNFTDKQFVFRLLKKNMTPSIKKATGAPIQFVGSHYIEAFSTIFEGGKTRILRYIHGESSVYKDEQSDDKDVPKKKFRIQFINGYKVVEGVDGNLVKYMMKDNLNASNPNRRTNVNPLYELIDTKKAIEKIMQDDELLDEAIAFCRKGDWEDVEAFARVLNVNLDQRAEEVRYDLRNIAKRDPAKFLADLNNPQMKKKHHVLSAIDQGYLVINAANNSIAWANNPMQPLDIAPIGTDVVDRFVNKLSTDEGQIIYSHIVDMVDINKPAPVKMALPTKKDLEMLKSSNPNNYAPAALSQVNESDSELMDLVQKAIERGIAIKKHPMWIVFMGKNFKKAEGFVNGLKGSPMMLKNLKYELNK